METVANTFLFVVLSGFVLAAFIPWLKQIVGKYIGWVVALLPLSFVVLIGSYLPTVAEGETIAVTVPWVPSLNINLDFYLDGLSLLMVLIVSGVGLFIMIYAGGYLQGDGRIGRFYVIILIFMAAMLGVVLADTLLLLFIFWELTSISSFMLIGFNHESPKSRRSAQQALLITGSGGLALLAGLILLANAGGTWQISELLAQGTAVQSHALYLPALILILAGAFTKSAQFPFHFWLPNAMAAPTPVSAYLHSATMVKAGVYLLARFHPILGGSGVWFYALVIFGGITAVLGAWLSWWQTDLKRIMAYSTVSALGVLVFLLGIGSKIALEAAMLFLLVHSLYKGGLFMAAGAIDHETGTRDVRRLAGLARSMPYTFVGVALAAMSMAGLPPLLGFIGKELIYEATLEANSALWTVLLTGTALITNIFLVAAGGVIVIKPFLGQPDENTAKPHHAAPISLWLGPVVLGLLSLGFGLFSTTTFVTKWLLQPASIAVYGHELELKLGLWHGFTPMLMLSALTIAAGFGLYAVHQRLRPGVTATDTAVSQRVGPETLYDRGFDGLIDFAGWLTDAIQDGYLRHYLLWIMGTLLVVVGGAFLRGGTAVLPTGLLNIGLNELMLTLVILGATLMIVTARSRLAAVAALGIVGYGMALIFILYGAPDLAMTQFSVETLTVILFVLVLYRLPYFSTSHTRRTRTRNIIISVLFGLLMSSLVLAASAIQVETHVTKYYAESSYLLAKGQNIVNVILVDFRAIDTMVEVTVLSVAAVGVYALLHTTKQQKAKAEAAEQQEASSGD
ncbi:MAG: putative monovalent cation/H+ antiporter subunit A [Chloroflexota bacterium]